LTRHFEPLSIEGHREQSLTSGIDQVARRAVTSLKSAFQNDLVLSRIHRTHGDRGVVPELHRAGANREQDRVASGKHLRKTMRLLPTFGMKDRQDIALSASGRNPKRPALKLP